MGTSLLPALGQPVIYVENDVEHLAWILEAEAPGNPTSPVDLLIYRRGRGLSEERLVPATGPRRWFRPELTPASRPKASGSG